MTDNRRPLTFLRTGSAVHQAVAEVAHLAGLPVGHAVEAILADHLGQPPEHPARAELVRAAVRRYKRDRRVPPAA